MVNCFSDSETALTCSTVNGKQLFDVANGETPEKLIFGPQVYAALPPDTKLKWSVDPADPGESFFAHFRELEATKSGCHHPDGCFWIQIGAHRSVEGKISILDIAPTILRHFGVPPRGPGGRALATT